MLQLQCLPLLQGSIVRTGTFSPRAKVVTRQGLAYPHHNRAPVSAELLETRDEAACLRDQHAGVIAVLTWIEYRAMHARDKFQERIAQLRQHGRW